MRLCDIPSTIFDLSALPRRCGGKPEIEKIAWFRDHVYWHRNALIDAENISFTLEEDPGEHRAKVNGEIVEHFTREGESALMLSGVAAGTRITTLATTRRNELLFRYSAGAAMMPEFPFGCRRFVMTPRFGRHLEELEEMLDHLHDPGIADQLDLLAWAMIAEALAASESAGYGGENRVGDKILRICNRIAANPAADANITLMAEQYGISRAVFYREWKKICPVSPYRFMLRKRLESARWLLLHSGKSVKEVAESAGFRSAPVFCEIFRKHFGCPPMSFRKKGKAAETEPASGI